MKNTPKNTPFWLDPQPVLFPPSHLALTEPNGLLAVGGDLTPEWLLHAYSKGLFPWFNADEPVLWWTPNPRSVLFMNELKIHKSLQKTLVRIEDNENLTVTFDQAFTQVMQACSNAPRPGQNGTWITPKMIAAYSSLHQSGHAHSVEVWQGDELVGGVYGVALGKMFYGESMFANVRDASKIGLVALCMHLKQWGFSLLDTQVETPHLKSLGARSIPRTEFEQYLNTQIQMAFPAHAWQVSPDWFNWVDYYVYEQKHAPSNTLQPI
ncbi:leucyl/phenylalanyl-tRNA--protein transferase [Thiomicrorhabdus aquaedulcis]|uniref:leucyl/phenylalanyl-tRNA--protein transferase n=1 Tax=Thiomicrorhabdus aquaedulcis TaxID=2211106 RepID=UPI000FD9B0A0|nr:leucyl/phenylalanyl-tRNA--protein transferase [Thiomicrorhabdus aquaedulcis]